MNSRSQEAHEKEKGIEWCSGSKEGDCVCARLDEGAGEGRLLDKKIIEIDPVVGPIIANLFAWYSDGTLSL
ncbi:hypothetical protein [Bradyrhizobium sp.]|uniref:hypothetical protein n=1 Tax=Bradyrhizobium sp. TaxID=376 RepID=UPI002CECB44C|nr:hypothetical protein [Bradyrhizobium sp.]HWX64390.1 hypothetical protein [Bradyrhizobium sp.]